MDFYLAVLLTLHHDFDVNLISGWVQLWSGTTVVRSTCGPGSDQSGADHSGTPPVFFIQSVIFMNVGLDKLYLNIFKLNNEYFLQK